MILGYVDPGLGALIWQSIVSAFVGFLFYFKKTRGWIAATIQGFFGKNQKSSNAGVKIPESEKVEIESDAR